MNKKVVCEHCGGIKDYRAFRCSNCHLSDCSGEKNANFDHGMALEKCTDNHYWVWSSMIQRCHNSKNKQYPDYGGRGIFVCDRWRKFKNFIEDMGMRPSELHSIDRIDNNSGYFKENCRWILRDIQNKNRRIFKNKTSVHAGVYFLKNKNVWTYNFRHNGKKIYGSNYKTEEIAFLKMTEKKKLLS